MPDGFNLFTRSVSPRERAGAIERAAQTKSTRTLQMVLLVCAALSTPLAGHPAGDETELKG